MQYVSFDFFLDMASMTAVVFRENVTAIISNDRLEGGDDVGNLSVGKLVLE